MSNKYFSKETVSQGIKFQLQISKIILIFTSILCCASKAIIPLSILNTDSLFFNYPVHCFNSISSSFFLFFFDSTSYCSCITKQSSNKSNTRLSNHMNSHPCCLDFHRFTYSFKFQLKNLYVYSIASSQSLLSQKIPPQKKTDSSVCLLTRGSKYCFPLFSRSASRSEKGRCLVSLLFVMSKVKEH